MILDLILLLVLNCLMIGGLFHASRYEYLPDKDWLDNNTMNVRGEVLWRLNYYAEYLPEHLYKPIMGCMRCMASFWSWPFLIYAVSNDVSLLYWPVYILALSGLNTIYERVTAE